MKKIILISAVVLSSCGVFQKKSLVNLTKKGYIKIPMQEFETAFYVEAFCNGKKGTFLVDTGSKSAVIKKDRLRKFGLYKKHSHEIPVKLGDFELKYKELIINKLYEGKIDGTIGARLFSEAKAIIDYENKNLYLAQNKKSNKDFLAEILKKNDYVKLKFEKYASGHIFCEAQVNGVKGRFLLDTGTQNPVVGKNKMKKFGLKKDHDSFMATNIYAQSGVSEGYYLMSRNHSLTIAGNKITFSKYSFLIFDLTFYNKFYKKEGEIDGIIGHAIFKGTKAIIDYGTNTLYLKKYEKNK